MREKNREGRSGNPEERVVTATIETQSAKRPVTEHAQRRPLNLETEKQEQKEMTITKQHRELRRL